MSKKGNCGLPAGVAQDNLGPKAILINEAFYV